MQALATVGDRFRIGPVTLEILAVSEDAVEVCINTTEGHVMAILAPDDVAVVHLGAPGNRLSGVLN